MKTKYKISLIKIKEYLFYSFSYKSIINVIALILGLISGCYYRLSLYDLSFELIIFFLIIFLFIFIYFYFFCFYTYTVYVYVYTIFNILSLIISVVFIIFIIWLFLLYPYEFTLDKYNCYFVFERKNLEENEILFLISMFAKLYNIVYISDIEKDFILNNTKVFSDVKYYMNDIRTKRELEKKIELHILELISKKDLSYNNNYLNFKNSVDTVLSIVGHILGLNRPVRLPEIFISVGIFVSCFFFFKNELVKEQIHLKEMEVLLPTDPRIFVNTSFTSNLSRDDEELELILKESVYPLDNFEPIISDKKLLFDIDDDISKIISVKYRLRPGVAKCRDQPWQDFAKEYGHIGDRLSGYYGSFYPWSGCNDKSKLLSGGFASEFFSIERENICEIINNQEIYVLFLQKEIQNQLSIISTKTEGSYINEIKLLKELFTELKLFEYSIEQFKKINEDLKNLNSFEFKEKNQALQYLFPKKVYRHVDSQEECTWRPVFFERGSKKDWMIRGYDRVHLPLCSDLEIDKTPTLNTIQFGESNPFLLLFDFPS